MLKAMKKLSLMMVAGSLVAACGNNSGNDGWVNPVPPIPPTPQCPVGQVYNPYLRQCMPGSHYYGYTNDQCSLPQPYSPTHDVRYCNLLPAVSYSGQSNIPYLPSAAQTQYAWWGPQLLAGDQVELMGEIRYGDIGWGVFIGDCSNEQNASSVMKGAVNDGYFDLPIGQLITVGQAGQLRVGMSIQKNCYETRNVQLKVLRTRGI